MFFLYQHFYRSIYRIEYNIYIKKNNEITPQPFLSSKKVPDLAYIQTSLTHKSSI